MHASVSLVIIVVPLMHQNIDGINEVDSQVDRGVLGMHGMAACPWPPRRRREVGGSVDVLLGNNEHVRVWTGVLEPVGLARWPWPCGRVHSPSARDSFLEG